MPEPTTPSSAIANRPLALGGLAVLGAIASLFISLLMIPELPPLLAGWPLRETTLAWLHRAGLFPARSALIALIFGLSVALPCFAAFIAWRRPAAPLSGRLVLLSAAAIALLHLASPPRWSSDAFLFAYYGKIQAVHHANPYALPGRAFARTCALPKYPHRAATPGRPCRSDAHCPAPSRCLVDPFVPYQSWLEVRAAYGPAALALFRLLYVEVAPPAANALVIRAVMALFFLLLVALALRLRGVRAAAVLAWLPLGAVVSANGGHLEPLIGLALVGLLVGASGRGAALRIGLSAALLAALKIHLGVLALPALALLWRQRGAAQAIAAAGLAAGLVGLGYGLLWVAPHPFGGLTDVGDTSIHSLLDLWRRLVHSLGGRGDLHTARLVFLGLWLLWVGWALRRQRRVLAPASAVIGAAASAAATLQIWLATTVLASGIYHPWYALPGLVIWLFGQAPDQPWLRGGRGALWLAVISPLAINGLWLACGPAAFTLPWVAAPTVLIFAPVLYFQAVAPSIRAAS